MMMAEGGAMMAEGGGMMMAEGGPMMTGDAGDAPAAPTTTKGGGFAGTYNCLGTLNLTATGSDSYRGDAKSVAGNTVTTYDISCTAHGNECVGKSTRFVAKGGGGPKSQGGTKMTFRLVGNGLEYNEGGATGFCARR
jgi:hypothetical protein